jgi:hypothetical protein
MRANVDTSVFLSIIVGVHVSKAPSILHSIAPSFDEICTEVD